MIGFPHGSLEHYARCERERIPGESLFNVNQRLIVEDTVAAFGTLKAAANYLQADVNELARVVVRSRKLRINVETGHPELNAHGSGVVAAPVIRRSTNSNRAMNLSRVQEGA